MSILFIHFLLFMDFVFFHGTHKIANGIAMANVILILDYDLYLLC